MRLIGPAILVWILWRFSDFGALVDTWRGARAWPLVAAVLLDAAVIHTKLVRWTSLLSACDVEIGAAGAYRAYLPSLFLGLATPGRVGDVVRVQYLKRDHGVSYPAGLAVSLVDRLCDVYVLLAFVSLGALHLAQSLSPPFVHAAWVGIAFVVFAPALAFVPRVAEVGATWLYRRAYSGGASAGLASFFAALTKQTGRALVAPVAATVAAFMINYVQAWLVARAFDMPLGFIDVVAVVSISSLLGLLPISVSGVGVREAFLAFVFPVAFGLSATSGIVFGLGVFVVIYAPALLVGFAAWQAWPPDRGPGAPTDPTSRRVRA